MSVNGIDSNKLTPGETILRKSTCHKFHDGCSNSIILIIYGCSQVTDVNCRI